MKKYYYLDNDAILGPAGLNEFIDGKITPSILVWRKGARKLNIRKIHA